VFQFANPVKAEEDGGEKEEYEDVRVE